MDVPRYFKWANSSPEAKEDFSHQRIALTKKPHLLFISYYFPPTKSIACVRNYNIASEFIKRFDVHVFTTSNQKRFTQDEYPALETRSCARLWTLDLRTVLPQRPLKSRVGKSKSISFLHKLLNSFPFNILFGIGGLLYVIHGILKGMSLIKREESQYLYSSYFPYTDHIICYFLKLWRPSLIWIADFRDLHYSPLSNELVFPKFQAYANRIILKKANVVTTVSEGLKLNLLPFNKNTIVVRNAFGELNRRLLANTTPAKNTSFTIAYTGNLIPNKRDPSMLFGAVAHLLENDQIHAERIRIQYAGNYSEHWSHLMDTFSLSHIEKNMGLVSLQESYVIQKNAHLNLLLSSSQQGEQGILTGKFYEYLAAGNPIILILKGERDEEFEEIFKKLNCGKIFYTNNSDDVANLQKFIARKYNAWSLKEDNSPRYDLAELEKHKTSFQVAKIYASLSI